MRAHLQETIGKARLSHAESLEAYVARAAALEAGEVRPAVDRVMAIVEGIPGLLESVADAAMTRGIGLMVQPLLDHAADYFRDPTDHAPEAAYGVAGLLDDAYLALSLVNLIHENFEPLVESDVTGQLAVLRQLLEPELMAELDAEVGRAVLKLARTVAGLRERSRLDNEFFIQRR
jgi:uncharacterized membrane protein YkvA (DUF1232 family)